MSDKKIQELVEKYESPEEIWETLMDEAPELPVGYRDLSMEEIRDLEVTETTKEETRQIADWMMYQRRAASLHELAKEEMADE